jgi:site-specific DNA-methyltransferase (adenine-specific)
MIDLNTFYCEDCKITMNKMKNNVVDLILTSPPYNMTKRKGGYADKEKRYDQYNDWKTEKEYNEWTVDLFKKFDDILNKNGVILYNFSYSIENPSLPYTMISSIINETNFTVADTIIWKKNTAIPHPASYNRLNRIVEFIFVIVRKNEIKTFNCYKNVTKISPKGQKYYEVIDNFITAKNNDKSTDLNKATYSTELCEKLLKIYSKKNDLIYDPFMGTGTTGLACKLLDRNFIGSEISKKQVEYSLERIK